MILTDREIQIAVNRRSIIIDPLPTEKAYSSTSVDLTLDENLSVYREPKAALKQSIDPSVGGFNPEEYLIDLTYPVKIDAKEGYHLRPNHLILAFTKEFLDLRQDVRVAARVEGKSSLARIGLSVHNTAPTIHAGFAGRVRLEIVNHGKVPLVLRTGMRICQLIFELTLGTPVKAYGGQYLGQSPSGT